jgi:hypothetical protein
MADLVAGFTEILVTEDVRDAAARLPNGVRTLDAVHIASAQILDDALDVLVTYDERMYDVAQSIGLPVAVDGPVRRHVPDVADRPHPPADRPIRHPRPQPRLCGTSPSTAPTTLTTPSRAA